MGWHQDHKNGEIMFTCLSEEWDLDVGDDWPGNPCLIERRTGVFCEMCMTCGESEYTPARREPWWMQASYWGPRAIMPKPSSPIGNVVNGEQRTLY